MTVPPILAVLSIVAIPEFAQRFAPLGFFVLLWLAIKLTTYVRAPIALYRMDNRIFNLRFRLVESWNAIDADVQRALEYGEQALEAIGFHGAPRITAADETPIPSVETLLEHAENGDLANVDAMISKRASDSGRIIAWVAYRTVFADETVLVTANVERDLMVFWPEPTGYRTVTLPDVRDPREVYRLHRARVDRKSASVSPVRLSRGGTPEKALAFATRQAFDSNQFQVSCGYRKLTANGYAFSMRGATLSAWRRLFPWKQIIAQEGKRRTAEVMRLS